MERPDDLPLRTGEDGGTVGEAAPGDVFTPRFVREHTDAATSAEFVDDSPLAGPDGADGIDAYVATHSEFDSWAEMATAAKTAWLERELGLL